MNELIVPAFFAGVLTFLAPCTLPLVPGFLAFIGGVDVHGDAGFSGAVRRRIFLNGLLYTIGFSIVFVLMGLLVGLGGARLIMYRDVLTKVGAVFVIFFGLYLLGASRLQILSWMQRERVFHPSSVLRPGNPLSSFLFGATFAFGWTPCIGPILGSVLFLASSSSTIGQGGVLLGVFALGLALPFLLLAIAIGSATQMVRRLQRWLPMINRLGGLLLVVLGVLLLVDGFGWWNALIYDLFSFINYDRLLDHL
jgi:cytochrome c-type biogenesis protein